jgi:hypothetical protein
MLNKSDFFVLASDLIKRSAFICILVVILLIGVTNGQAVAKQTSDPFEATFTGNFFITADIGKSALFIVEETGSGTEIGQLGSFTYTTYVPQNVMLTPSGCASGSSTGIDGSGILTFADGTLRLHRVSGISCFAFPTIRVEEQWVIASGTGAYTGATGKLTRNLIGDVRFGTSGGSLSGSIKKK